MKNDKSFGLIDDLSIDHNGNQISSVSDAVDENLDYEGAFDFADGDDKNKEYAYNGNGALTMDLNRSIDKIEYDLLGNPIKLTIDNNTKRIEYVYAADGRRLKTKHSYITYVTKPRLHREIFSDSIEYIGNLILKNGKPDMYLFSGGYYSFDGYNKPECHYYIADYQGNNRMVVNAHTNAIEQATHYYPYGGIIGNLSSNQEAQKYKYSNKELDRTYGLDLYDFHARLFNPALPVFDRPDDHATDYYPISPYAYCAGDPVNCVDPDGKDIYRMDRNGTIKFYKVTNDSFHTIERVYAKTDNVIASFSTDKYLVEGIAGNMSMFRSVTTADREKALDLFCFLANNSGDDKEWCLNTYSTQNGDQYLIGTTPDKKMVDVSSLETMNGLNSSDKVNDVHSHPGKEGTRGGSGYDGANGDKQRIDIWETNYPNKKSPTYFVYHPESKKFYEYNNQYQAIPVEGLSKEEYVNR